MFGDPRIHHRNEVHHEQRGHGQSLRARERADHPDDPGRVGARPGPGLDRPVDGDLLQDAWEALQVRAEVKHLVPERHAWEQG